MGIEGVIHQLVAFKYFVLSHYGSYTKESYQNKKYFSHYKGFMIATKGKVY